MRESVSESLRSTFSLETEDGKGGNGGGGGEDEKAGAINPIVETKRGNGADRLRSGTFNPARTSCHNVLSAPVFLCLRELHPFFFWSLFFFLAKSAALGFKGKENDVEFCCTIRSLESNECINRCYFSGEDFI